MNYILTKFEDKLMKSAVTQWRTVSRVLIRPNPCHIGQSNVTLWHQNSSCELQTWQGCSYLISAPICFKKIAKFTGDVPLHAYLVKTRRKPAKPQPDPWPSLPLDAKRLTWTSFGSFNNLEAYHSLYMMKVSSINILEVQEQSKIEG